MELLKIKKIARMCHGQCSTITLLEEKRWICLLSSKLMILSLQEPVIEHTTYWPQWPRWLKSESFSLFKWSLLPLHWGQCCNCTREWPCVECIVQHHAVSCIGACAPNLLVQYTPVRDTITTLNLASSLFSRSILLLFCSVGLCNLLIFSRSPLFCPFLTHNFYNNV